MKSILPPIAISLALIMQPVQAESDTNDCNFILDGAQQVYDDLFPSDPAPQFSGPWCYRYYPKTEIYAGIYQGAKSFKTDGVYVLGGIFGDTPVYIDQKGVVINLLKNQMDKSLCDSTALPEGLIIKDEGNITTMTTGGECIKLPASNNYCEVLPETDEDREIVATGIHVLSSTNITDYKLLGFEMPDFPKIPGLPSLDDPFKFLKDDLANQTVCVIHAPTKLTDHTIKTDICFDLSDQIGDLAPILGIADKVTVKFKGVTTAKTVKDCFDTDALVISDLKTGESWLNQDGKFVKTSE